MTLKVCDSETGSFRIRTATGSLSVLDLVARALIRYCAAVEPAADHPELGMSILRRDGQTLQVHRIIRLEVGLPAMLLLQVRTDDPTVPTLRGTSRVVAITPLSDHEEGEQAL